MALPYLDQWLIRRMQWPSATVVPTREEVCDWQCSRLRDVVSHASANSPFYARHFSDVAPSAIYSLDDFSHLPMMTPDDVCNAPEQLLCVSQDEIARVVTLQSSGTTGPPKRVFHTEEDLEATTDYFGWGMSNLVGAGQTAFVLMPGDRPGGVGKLLMDALERTGARAVAHGIMKSGYSALDHCVSEGADCVVGSAAHVNMLAYAWEKSGLPKDRIRSVLLCWDVTPTAVVRNVERVFGCQVFRHWGMIETGLGGAVECAPKSGLHLRETDVFMEIVDPDSGALLPDGVFGEMVVTTPLRWGMPLIRYRTGDMGRILTGDCSCGSPLRRLDPLVYRKGDGVDIGAGSLSLRELNEVLYAVPGLEDFSASFNGRILHVLACGHGDGLSQHIQSEIERMPDIENSMATGEFEVAIDINRDGTPAVAGLGKRRIQIDLEN